MEWLSMAWISANWMPLLVTLLLGFILGWLLTGLSPRRKNSAYEAQIADLESRSRKSERELTDSRKEVDRLKSAVVAGENSLGDVRSKLTATQAELQSVGEEKSTFEADVQSRNIEVADLKMQLALLQDQYDKTKSSAAAEAESLHAAIQARLADISSLSAERDALSAEVASVRVAADQALHSLSSKDAALNESYQRVVNLQRVLEDRDAALAGAQSELGTLRTDVSSLNNIKAELEDRLQKARGNVAGEMAVLTSTMIKMKEDQLTMANVRIAELTNELNATKAGQAVG
jgi:chromosome segregation ATPase